MLVFRTLQFKVGVVTTLRAAQCRRLMQFSIWLKLVWFFNEIVTCNEIHLARHANNSFTWLTQFEIQWNGLTDAALNGPFILFNFLIVTFIGFEFSLRPLFNFLEKLFIRKSQHLAFWNTKSFVIFVHNYLKCKTEILN